jgi:hypothetical protein
MPLGISSKFLNVTTECRKRISYYVDEYIPSGNINTIKKNTVNLLVTIEQSGLEGNIGKCNYILSLVRIIQKKLQAKGLCIS